MTNAHSAEKLQPFEVRSHQKSFTRSSPVNPAASSHTVNSLFNKLSTWSYSWHLTAFEESAYFKNHWEGKPITHRTSSQRRSPQVLEFGLLLLLQFRKGQLSISSGKDVSFNSCRTWRISRAFQHMNWREHKARNTVHHGTRIAIQCTQKICNSIQFSGRCKSFKMVKSTAANKVFISIPNKACNEGS